MDDSPRQLPGVHKIELVQVNADSFCRLASNTDAQVDLHYNRRLIKLLRFSARCENCELFTEPSNLSANTTRRGNFIQAPQ